MPTIKRKVEVVAFERVRVVSHAPPAMPCPVCELTSELLPTRQGSRLAQVRVESIRRWIAQGKIHGVKTPGGRYRICRKSLFLHL